MSTSLGNILEATRRVAFDNTDGLVLQGYLKQAIKHGLDVKLLATTASELQEMMADGILLMHSNTLDVTFLFVKVDAGKGFFGGQKSRVQSYLGDANSLLNPGPVFSGLAMGVTSINNIYRGVGVLSGAAI